MKYLLWRHNIYRDPTVNQKYLHVQYKNKAILCRQGESTHTLVLTIKMQKWKISILRSLIPNLVLKVLTHSNESQFLINKDKNRGRFSFTFPHPSLNGMSVWVNSPWAYYAGQENKTISVKKPEEARVHRNLLT
jgi:hypothetical protein